MISIKYPMCGKKLNVSEEKIGKKGRCPSCGETVVLNIIDEHAVPPEPADTDAEKRLRKLERTIL